MSRSGYNEDSEEDPLMFGRWRGIVASATRGKRGQRYFRDLVAALDALPEKKLVKSELERPDGAVCALGALGRYRGVDLSQLDTYEHDDLGATFDIASALAAETMYENDEARSRITDEERWVHVRRWAVRQIHLHPEELVPIDEPTPVLP